MIFSIISQQYKRQNLFADLFKDRNNILTFPLLLLLLSLLFSFQGAILKNPSPAAKPLLKFSLLTFLFTRK